ncbi:cytochrome b/b6 domain-containing protein [Roseomonas marmotae]|uniref:Cytochrome b/b6 domain-containing protein n=1 Tax=Roseomonas marmotae TaxID=2768161 RepID=A0ABS3K813_9PROT|nr:cytochrome b/b6 domain-containing protein [Roseomonas marmotae]MBO1073602.1 cytochrome b/b6 domain-containing protein [Roseomonas marmotae]QTI80217.1 cytochrome b/b6 domain-containing protein [Roseomonas marmotae]
MSVPLQRVKVWDPWIRLVHWGLVVLLALSWWSAKTDRMDLHLISGQLVLGLLVFRIGWGIWGSDTARFTRFLRSPIAALAHLRHFGRQALDTEMGHNAAGGWMVLVMLALLLVQTASGLMAGDFYDVHGPLAERVPGEVNALAGKVHDLNFNLILVAVGLHILAVLLYALVKRHDLVRPMVTGVKRMPPDIARHPPRIASPMLAACWLAVVAVAVLGLFRLG